MDEARSPALRTRNEQNGELVDSLTLAKHLCADIDAFTALMRHLKAVDTGAHGTDGTGGEQNRTWTPSAITLLKRTGPLRIARPAEVLRAMNKAPGTGSAAGKGVFGPRPTSTSMRGRLRDTWGSLRQRGNLLQLPLYVNAACAIR